MEGKSAGNTSTVLPADFLPGVTKMWKKLLIMLLAVIFWMALFGNALGNWQNNLSVQGTVTFNSGFQGSNPGGTGQNGCQLPVSP
jgi:hypothetical protein